MSKIYSNVIAAKWITLGTSAKAVIISTVFLVVVGGVSLPVYLNYQNQQALILAEQQEQERLTAEQAEAERVAAEEQARLEQEAQAEAERLAAEAEATRLEMERIAAEEEQAQLEAEAQAETERVAAEESAAEQARQQAEAAEQQQSTANPIVGDENNRTDTSSGTTSSNPREEPTSGVGRERADRVGGVWDPDQGGWVYVTETGERVLIRPNGASRSLDSPIVLN